MAAQGNSKLYAFQKAKHLTLILLASLLLSVSYVRAEVVLYCQAELATGIFQDKQTGQWRTGSFHEKRYTIKFNDDYTSVTGWGDEQFPCAPPSYLPYRIVCSKPIGDTFIYDRQTRRFLNSTAGATSYIGKAGVYNTDTAEIYAGTCQKF